jgi:hypothetical protein
MDALCQGLGPVSLTVEGLGQTDDYFTSLYIKLAGDDPQRAFHRAASAIRGSYSPRIGSHVSLIYSDRVRYIDRAGLVQELRLSLPQRIAFESVQLVMPATGNWRDVASWEVKHSARLTPER